MSDFDILTIVQRVISTARTLFSVYCVYETCDRYWLTSRQSRLSHTNVKSSKEIFVPKASHLITTMEDFRI